MNFELDYLKTNMEEFDLGKSLWLRFVRGSISGAVSSGATLLSGIAINNIQNLTDLKILGMTLLISLIVGAVTGGILTLDKYFRT